MFQKIKCIIHDTSGQVLPIFAVFLVALLFFVALVIDGSYLYYRNNNLQNVADIVVRAGAQQMMRDDSLTLDVCRKYAILNDVSADSVRVTYKITGDSGFIEVVLSNNDNVAFGQLLGSDVAVVRSIAKASVTRTFIYDIDGNLVDTIIDVTLLE